ncbi:MAG: type II secretion system protein [Alphaproteobacteria bacterium]
MKHRASHTDLKSGFTMMEIAIVIGIIGLIAGAIWAAGSKVLAQNALRNAERQLAIISQNMRAAYAEQGGVAGIAATLTPALDKMRIFPAELRANASNPNGMLFHIWNRTVQGNGFGTVQIAADNCAGVVAGATISACFQVSFLDLPSSACINLATETSRSDSTLQRIIINGTLVGDRDTPGTPLPVPPSVAQNECSLTDNDVIWVYLLRDNRS